MPKLIRYVLAELIKVFLLALVVLTGLFLIGGVAREAIGRNLPLAQVIALIPYLLPEGLRYTIPVTLLLATSVVYGRMSGSNEVVAIKALGISPMRILWPALALAFLISLVTVVLNDLVSWGRRGAEQVVVDAAEEIVYSVLRAQHRYSLAGFAINVKGVDDRTLILPTLTLMRDSGPPITIMAKEAEIRADREENVLTFVLRQPTFDVGGRITGYFPDVYPYKIPLADASRADLNLNTPSTLPSGAIAGQIVRQRQLIERFEQELASRAACQMLCGELDSLAGPEWDAYRHQLAGYRQNLCKLRTEPHRRWAGGLSCLCFVWIGAPMAIWLRNRDFLTSFFLCFAPILIVYYPALMYGIDGAKNGTIPPYSVWTGNLILLGFGYYLLRRVIRY